MDYKALAELLFPHVTETPEEVERRLHNAIGELTHKDKYQYKVINDELDEAVRTVQTIIEAQRHARAYYSVEVPEE